MAAATLIVLFGAAVRPDGRPSQALSRRIAAAARAAAATPQARVFCSGAAGKAGPSEASVMARELVARGVAAARLVLDAQSRDTLQSVLAAARAVRRDGYQRLIVCSDGYHLPRIRLMFAALGFAAEPAPAAQGPGGAHRLHMRLREAVALPYDLAIILTRRGRLLADIATAAGAAPEDAV